MRAVDKMDNGRKGHSKKVVRHAVRRADKKVAGLTVAVVLKPGRTSGRYDGDWGSFVGEDKATEITHAIEAKSRWEAKGYGPYTIYCGTLTEVVTLPTSYKVSKLKAGA
jgi:hypothetical protein